MITHSTKSSTKQPVTPIYQNEWHELRVNLLATANWLENEIKHFLKSYGVTQKQFNVLRILRGTYPESLTMQEVRIRMIDKMSDASRIIDRLARPEIALVIKTPCTEDKRSNRVTISQKGLDLLATIDNNIENLDAITQNITAAQAKKLNQLLKLIIRDS